MRKLILTFIAIICSCFLIPIVFSSKPKSEKVSAEANEQIQENSTNSISSVSIYDYGEYNTIKLLHAKTNKIEEINLDEYLYGVVSAEMPANYEIEALKAQAVVARTYTFYQILNNKNKHENANICDDSTCCQAWISKEDRFARWDKDKQEEYWNKITTAVNDTKGKVITYENKVINAFFHSNSGGMTEAPVNVWGGTGYPYLQAVETSGEDAYSQYSSEVELTFDEVVEKIKETHKDVEIDFNKDDAIKILEYTDSGRVKTIKFGNVELSGVETRTIMGLRSANFSIEIKDKKVKFTVKGYGHGVGMSQTGADSLAKQGKNYEEIIHHYYTDVEIINYK